MPPWPHRAAGTIAHRLAAWPRAIPRCCLSHRRKPTALRPPDVVPRHMALLAHGRAFLSSMLATWWACWRHRRPGSTSPGDLLRCAVRDGAPIAPTGALAIWLRQHDWDGAPLDAAAAAQWASVWDHDQAMRRRSAVHPLLAGPGTRPQGLSQYLRTGRALFKHRSAGRGVRGPDGAVYTDRATMDELLWRDREDLWTSAPPQPPHGQALLDSYFRHRRVQWPAHPLPDRQQLVSLVLAQRGSAPGIDDEPYEVYHQGAAFVATLLGQAHYASAISDDALAGVLGLAHDLLVWIPKLPAAVETKEWRPLQLPTCFRRLFGASVGEIVGPPIEAQLAAGQTAKRGGDCGRNIRQVYRHLEGVGPDPPAPDLQLWRAVLGPAADTATELADAAHDEAIAHCPAALFADQSKAFERLSHAWLDRVLQGWQFPP